MSTEPVQRDPVQELVVQVNSDNFRGQIEAALPGNMAVARFVRVTTTAIRENPDLVNAERSSLFSAVVRCAQDGLLPDSREAALVMFGNKATYMPMISGFRKIAAEAGWSLRTRVVYENDTFDHTHGMDETLVHHPARPGLERGEMVAAYAVATHKDGRKEIEVVYAEDIAKVRKVSRTANRGPWVEWPERMWEKTAGRRLFAKLPLEDRERVESILDADDSIPAAVQLYGPHAAPDGPPPGDDGAEQAAGEVNVEEGRKAEPTAQVASETDGAPAPAHADEVEEVEAEVVEESGFKAPVDAGETPELIAANDAAEVVFESGKYKSKSLREVAGDGSDGPAYLRWVIANWKTPAFRDKVIAFCSVYVPSAVEDLGEAS